MRKLVRRLARIVPRPVSDVVAAKAKKHGILLSPDELCAISHEIESTNGKGWKTVQRNLRKQLWREIEEETEKRRLLDYRDRVYVGTSGLYLLSFLEFSKGFLCV